MPWVVGIDEAGYGPNLGPLVQACVAIVLPDSDPHGWDTFRSTVRKSHEPDDGRMVIDDSKKVYAGTSGLERLERAAYSLIHKECSTFGAFAEYFFPTIWDRELFSEQWYRGEMPLPLSIGNGHRRTSFISNGEYFAFVRIVPTSAFNRTVSRSGSKATALAEGLLQFLPHAHRQGVDVYRGMPVMPMTVTCDKLGGRNFYGPILQEAFPDGWPVAEVEGALESRYRIMNVGRDITVSFKPRADGENVCVALASMLAKYVREVCMKQFNEFWAKHVPGIKPTAGYPLDAKRFYAEIRPAMERLGIEPDAVWRKK